MPIILNKTYQYISKLFIKAMINLLSRRAGKTQFQEFFEYLNLYSLNGMNIGGGADPNSSGEKEVLDYLSRHFESSNDLTIFDVGANVGSYSMLLKETFGEKAEIYSFEPSNKTFNKLKSNIGHKTRVNLYNFGFGDLYGKITLYSDSSDESGLASIYKRRLDHFNIEMNEHEEIEIKTIDTFCDECKIERIHFLKLDVEGNELKVLEGASRTLNSGRIDYLQFEFGGCNLDSRTYFQDFYYLLKDKYKIYRIVKDGLYQIVQYKEMYEAFMTTNYLAERK